ncbi:MAG: helical backbone metal receptor [Bacteroidota bacterium]|nr:helical backbone metal receptor [Bacteroidota bacterium]
MNIFSIKSISNNFNFKDSSTKIVSLVPSITESLFYFGLKNNIKGITKYCIHPKSVTKDIPKIGGTKTVDIEKIRMLNPDIIIASKEENLKMQIETLAIDFKILLTDVNSLNDCLDLNSAFGNIFNKVNMSKELNNKIVKGFKTLNKATKKTITYLIWENPVMIVAKNTYINDIISKIGFINAFSHLDRYPLVTDKQLTNSKSNFIFLSSEPCPFAIEHIGKYKKLCSESKIILVNGELFGWYGSRLLEAIDYFKELKNDLMG